MLGYYRPNSSSDSNLPSAADVSEFLQKKDKNVRADLYLQIESIHGTGYRLFVPITVK
jgi:hypothetical protein